MPRRLALIAAALTAFALPAGAADIMVHDAYARAATPAAPTGAAFLTLMNHGDTDDRLIGVASPVAHKVELHTHIEDETGILRMRPVDGGLDIPAGESITLQRGGDHIMFMGLTEPFTDGKTIPVTLIFETAGEVETEIVVDLTRKPEDASGHAHDHSQD